MLMQILEGIKVTDVTQFINADSQDFLFFRTNPAIITLV
jgi:hypothetical protein